MNDERSAQLTSTWPLPAYAQDHLWIEGFSGAVRCEGVNGLFELPAPSPSVVVYWHDVKEGAALACLRWQVDSLEWDGQIRIGGYVDTIHLTQAGVGGLPVSVLTIGGQPLNAHYTPFPPASFRATTTYKPDFHDSLMTDVPESYSTWILPLGSPLTDAVQNALIHNLRLYCFGRLADANDPEEAAFVKQFALPIVLESLTIFAP